MSIRQWFCSHEFNIEDIRRVSDESVKCECRKCGKELEASCGLNLRGRLTQSDIRPGDTWVLKDLAGNPFSGDHGKVEIIARKRGWVNYKFKGSSMFQNESKMEKTFRYIYQPDHE